MKRLVALSAAITVLVLAASAVVVAKSVDAGGGGCHDPLTDAEGTSVNLKHNCFLPTVLRVEPGTTVEFESHDQQLHTVTSAGVRSDSGWGSFDELGLESVVTETFEEPGVFPYFCILHPGMIGTIVVGDGVPADASVTNASLGVAAADESESSAELASEQDAGDGSSIALAASGAGVLALLVGFVAGGLVWRWRSG